MTEREAPSVSGVTASVPGIAVVLTRMPCP